MDCQYRDVARMIDHSLLSPILKVEELEKGIRVALDDGGQELDAVVNLSKVLSGDWDTVAAEVLEECKRRLGISLADR